MLSCNSYFWYPSWGGGKLKVLNMSSNPKISKCTARNTMVYSRRLFYIFIDFNYFYHFLFQYTHFLILNFIELAIFSSLYLFSINKMVIKILMINPKPSAKYNSTFSLTNYSPLSTQSNYVTSSSSKMKKPYFSSGFKPFDKFSQIGN